MKNTQYGEEKNALQRRAESAASSMNSAWMAGVLLSIVATLGLFATKLL